MMALMPTMADRDQRCPAASTCEDKAVMMVSAEPVVIHLIK